MARDAAHRRIGALLFLLLFATYGYFHQGGGWNPNGRFGQVRAIVEQGRLDVDDQILFLLELGADGRSRYRRIALSDDGATSPRLPRANGLDLSLAGGRYYPNKPPGITFLAVPVYFAIHALERAADIDPDAWWPLTVNLYLTTVFSIGLLSALGGLVFYHASRRLFPGVGTPAHVAATLVFGLGTLVLPYATMMIDHGVVAACSLLALWLVLAARDHAAPGTCAGLLFAAGTVAGIDVLLNNSAALTALGLGAFALWACRPRALALAYVAGGVAPALVLGWYQWACFGDPFAIPQTHQLTIFQSASSPILGIFDAPRWSVIPKLLFPPYRGLFFSSPVLLLGVYGLWRMAREGRRAEAVLFVGLALAFLLMNASFNGWHGGSGFGPRYLIPAVPFLALPLAPVFERLPRVSAFLAVPSLATMLLVTCVDPQISVHVQRPLRDFYLPLAAGRGVRVDRFTIQGPVSAHPHGVPGDEIGIYSPTTEYARWNAFNLGEFLFRRSWASVLPLVIFLSALGAWLFRRAARVGEGGRRKKGAF